MVTLEDTPEATLPRVLAVMIEQEENHSMNAQEIRINQEIKADEKEIRILGATRIETTEGVKAKKFENSSKTQEVIIIKMSKEKITKAISDPKIEIRAMAELDQTTHTRDTVITAREA